MSDTINVTVNPSGPVVDALVSSVGANITSVVQSGGIGPAGPAGPAGAAGPTGSDASVTSTNITNALGYTPVNAENNPDFANGLSINSGISQLRSDGSISVGITSDFQDGIVHLTPYGQYISTGNLWIGPDSAIVLSGDSSASFAHGNVSIDIYGNITATNLGTAAAHASTDFDSSGSAATALSTATSRAIAFSIAL